MSETFHRSNAQLRADLAKYLPLAKSHLLMIAHRDDLSISTDAKARLVELDVLEKQLRAKPDESVNDPMVIANPSDSQIDGLLDATAFRRTVEFNRTAVRERLATLRYLK